MHLSKEGFARVWNAHLLVCVRMKDKTSTGVKNLVQKNDIMLKFLEFKNIMSILFLR